MGNFNLQKKRSMAKKKYFQRFFYLLNSVHCVQGINDQYHNSYSNAECFKKAWFFFFLCFQMDAPNVKIIFIILKMTFYCFVELGKELYLWYILQTLDSEVLYILKLCPKGRTLCQIKIPMQNNPFSILNLMTKSSKFCTPEIETP